MFKSFLSSFPRLGRISLSLPLFSPGQHQQQYQQRGNYQLPAARPQYQQEQQQHSVQQQQRPVYQQQQQRPAIQQQPQQQQNRAGQAPGNIGPCFTCEQHGHLANSCPKKGQALV